jgi:predicted dehydrogenase
VPAIALLDEFVLTAVSTTRQESARAAADAFGARYAFADAGELAAHPEVDLVVVSVKAPAHAAVTRAALAAGKHILSEWPLGVDVAEARALSDAAAEAGVVHAISLQGYHSPSARFVADLVSNRRIGQVESVAMITDGDPLGGNRIPQSLAYSNDRAAANNVLTIMVGHSLAVLDTIIGSAEHVSAVVANHHDHIRVNETAETIANDAPGQVAVLGRLVGGAVFSLTAQGGSAAAPDGFVIKISGADGTLTITPRDPGHYPGWADWRIMLRTNDGTITELAVPARYSSVPAELPAGPAANIAALYRELGSAIREGRPAQPNFHTAVRHHETLDAIERAADTGKRQIVTASS